MKANESLENNPFKAKIRNEIADQIITWAKKLSKKSIHGATLPGQYANFENLLIKKAKAAGITVTLDCYEDVSRAGSSWELYFQMEENIPKEATPHETNIVDADFSKLDFAWFDFCGNPWNDKVGFTLLNSLLNFEESRKSKPSLFYATFLTIGRVKGGKDLVTRKINLRTECDNARTVEDAVRSYYKEYLNSTCIMGIDYLGGERIGTDMLTVGFQTGRVKILPCISEDWRVSIRKERRDKYGNYNSNRIEDSEKAVAEMEKMLDEQHALMSELAQICLKCSDTLTNWKYSNEARRALVKRLFKKGWSNNLIAKYIESLPNALISSTGTLANRGILPDSKRERIDARSIAAITNHLRKNTKTRR